MASALRFEAGDHDYALSWHRDTIKSSATDEEEKRELETPRFGVQWNACVPVPLRYKVTSHAARRALYDDDCLLGVPRSHLRIRTPEERHATSASDGSLPMPGGKVLHLDAGQVIFYDNQILHRGCEPPLSVRLFAALMRQNRTYDSSRKRATMHGSYQDSRESPSRGSGVLQHGTEWMASDAFRQSLTDAPKESLDMLDRALAWGERARAVGFSYAQADI